MRRENQREVTIKKIKRVTVSREYIYIYPLVPFPFYPYWSCNSMHTAAPQQSRFDMMVEPLHE